MEDNEFCHNVLAEEVRNLAYLLVLYKWKELAKDDEDDEDEIDRQQPGCQSREPVTFDKIN